MGCVALTRPCCCACGSPCRPAVPPPTSKDACRERRHHHAYEVALHFGLRPPAMDDSPSGKNCDAVEHYRGHRDSDNERIQELPHKVSRAIPRRRKDQLPKIVPVLALRVTFVHWAWCGR